MKKLELYEKVAEALSDLKNSGYGVEWPNYIAKMKEGIIYVVNEEIDHNVLEIKDERTIINHCQLPHHGGYSYFWEKSIGIFKQGLEKRVGHKIEMHNKEIFDLHRKIEKAVEELKREPRYRKMTKEYMTIFGTEDNVYIYDCGTIIFEMKDEKKLINKYKILPTDSEWAELVKTFARILEEKLGNKVKVKDKGKFVQ